MKKRISRLMAMVLLLALILGNSMTALAAGSGSTLSISSPKKWEAYSWDDSLNIRWNRVRNAAGYYVTIKNDDTDEYYLQNKYTTSTSLSAGKYLPEACAKLKIWVGAVKAKSDKPTSAFTSEIIYMYLAHEPAISGGSCSAVSDTGAELSLSISKNYGYSVTDYGFYLGTSPGVSRMNKISCGSANASKGTKTLVLSDLTPDTTYYYAAYAENLVGESISGVMSFRTAAASAVRNEAGDPRHSTQPALPPIVETVQSEEVETVKIDPQAGKISRSAVIDRANRWGDYIWTTDREWIIYGNHKIPANARVRGIPYSFTTPIYSFESYQDLATDEKTAHYPKPGYVGMDCAGLIYEVLNAAGIQVKRGDGTLADHIVPLASHTDTDETWKVMKAGDLLWRDGVKGKDNHYAIIVSVNDDGSFTVVDVTTWNGGTKIGSKDDSGVYMIGTCKRSWTLSETKRMKYSLVTLSDYCD